MSSEALDYRKNVPHKIATLFTGWPTLMFSFHNVNLYFLSCSFTEKEDVQEAVLRIQKEGGLYTHTDRALEVMTSTFR